MKKLTLGYCPVGHGSSPLDDVFGWQQDVSKLGFEGVDAVVFWGGADIHPSLWNHSVSRKSQAGNGPSGRDLFEWGAMKYCKMNKIKKNTAAAHKAQYWFLAGIRTASGGALTPYLDIVHRSGRNLLTEPLITA